MITPEQVFAQIDIPDVPDSLHGTMEFRVNRQGMRLSGFVGWFTADLAPGIVLDTRPGIRTHWGQMFFPVLEQPLSQGDLIKLNLGLHMDETYRSVFEWSGQVMDRRGNSTFEFRHSSERRFQKAAESHEFT